MSFSPELEAKVAELWKRYPHKKAAIIPAMHLIQAERDGWFSDDTIRDTAQLFGVPDMHVRGIVGFYDMFHDAPVGRHVVRFCKTLSCQLRGARELRAHVAEKYGVKNGETTEDGAFTFKCFECLGHCANAPMMLVDDEKHLDLTVEKLDAALEALR